jgi:hypothetical protein
LSIPTEDFRSIARILAAGYLRLCDQRRRESPLDSPPTSSPHRHEVTVTPLSLVETAGSLFQSPQYNNGTPLPVLGGLSGLDRIGAGTPSGGGLVIQLDGPGTTALLRGEAVQAIADNPRAVQSAGMNAAKSNAGRREMTVLQISPGTLVA